MSLKSQLPNLGLMILMVLVVPYVLSDVVSATVGGRKVLKQLESGGNGPWQSKVKLDVNSPEVVELARFAVSEHNKKAGTNVVYKRTRYADVEATTFILFIEPSDSPITRPYYYGAVILIEPPLYQKNLTYFGILHLELEKP